MTSSSGEPLIWPFKRTDPLDPPPEYASLRADSPAVDVCLWNGDDAVLLTKFDDIRLAFQSPNFSADTTKPGFPFVNATAEASKKGQKAMMTRLDPPRHNEHRRMLMKYFTPKTIESHRPFVRELVEQLLIRVDTSDRAVDIVSELAFEMPVRLIFSILGMQMSESDFFLGRIQVAFSTEVTPQESAGAHHDIIEYCERLIVEREAAPGDDLISELVINQLQPGHLSREELQYMLLMILMGGIDTSANMTSLGVLTFLRNPDQLDLLRKDPSLVPGAIEELLRFLSIVHFTAMRLSTGETEFSTRTVPAGQRIIAPLGAANRDPDAFPNPDKFDITRSARSHLGFGSGVHQCLGQAMARMELQELFAELFRRFPKMELAVPEEDLVFHDSLVYALESLPVFLHGKSIEGER